MKMRYQCDCRRRISSRGVVSQRQQPCTPKFNSSWDGLVCSLPHIRNNKCTHPPFSKMWFAFPRCRGNPCSKNSLLGGKDALALSQATTHYLENLPLQKIICSYFVFFFKPLILLHLNFGSWMHYFSSGRQPCTPKKDCATPSVGSPGF